MIEREESLEDLTKRYSALLMPTTTTTTIAMTWRETIDKVQLLSPLRIDTAFMPMSTWLNTHTPPSLSLLSKKQQHENTLKIS